MDSFCTVLSESLVHLFLVQLDSAIIDVLGALRDKLSLVEQTGEGNVIYDEAEFVCWHIVEDLDLP